ncbi:GDA1/CD39 nucleoside phosphatase family protein [Aspergillus parasiticus SU-1]|uniref:guanosine-diphosphatase n=2 Tax=Aspergillus parasiticus TaxID=5067 RepID=A0A5N6D7G1_ASPPA|nr:nucleoside phosphatase family-domain-containing protein [Aspergillus parasiticus]KJK66752.1 GDA1/CD39 nucleoside phosphatase family protein [Aspergillus parasiticus SU-1]
MSTGVDGRHINRTPSFQKPGSRVSRRPNSRASQPANNTPSYSPDTCQSPSTDIMAQSQRSRYLKTGAIVGALFLMILWLSPSKPAVTGFGREKSPVGAAPLTDKCTKPHDPSKPLIQYALMIDAGSQGSRIHVYRFNNCGPTPELEHEEFEQTEKRKGGSGLSSYKEDAEGAAKSLDPLMQVAMRTVPEEYKSCSPVAVKATAGLRMLGPEMSQNILEAVRHRLETVYPFPVVSREKGGVEIMDGSDEGVYAWITTNYLLGKIGGPDETPTAAIFDLGGGSTQIVFQPTFEKSKSGGMPERLADGDHKYELQFGGRGFDLYQHSHLGYGLMAAREAIHKAVVEGKMASSGNDMAWLNQPIPNPCIAPGMERDVEVKFDKEHPLGSKVTVKMVGPQDGSSSPALCRGFAEKILKKDAECKLAPCSFNGVHQPSLEKTFSREDVYIFSYFFDRTKPLGMPDSFTLEELHQLTSTVCAGESSWKIFEGMGEAMAELRDRPEWCLDLNFMLALLHSGYEMPLSREVKIAKKIKNNELGWCLGASLPLLSQESGWTCRVKEVS